MALRRYMITLIVAVILALFVRVFLFTAYRVPSSAMEPTLKTGDFIFSARAAYGFKTPFSRSAMAGRTPMYGDLVVFSFPNRPGVNFIKRVVGLPGDRIEMKGSHLILNGQPIQEIVLTDEPAENPDPLRFDLVQEHIEEKFWRVLMAKNPAADFKPIVVPPGEIFVLGDRRDSGDDSRNWGTVPMSQISGQAVLIWLSLGRDQGGRESESAPAARVSWPQLRWSRMFTRL